MGQPIPRIDGRDKVTGAARYPSDVPVSNPAYAYLVTSAVARGKVSKIDIDRAMTLAGVLDVLTWQTLQGQLKPGKFWKKGGTAATTIQPLQSDQVRHDGEILAVVLADTFEAAREGAHKIDIEYQKESPTATFDGAGIEVKPAAEGDPQAKDPAVGDAESALQTAPVKIAVEYSTPTQHHNAMELFTTTCAWDGDKLTVYEPSQFVYGLRAGVAEQIGIPESNVRVISTYVGGAFGSKGSVTPRTALIALASKRLGRPVKLVATRAQGFTIATYRAETRHVVKLGTQQDGRLVALSHEGYEVTSRPDTYTVAGTDVVARMYAVPNIYTKVYAAHADRNTPGFMRSPPEVPYIYALESAIDELAVELGMDPVELRRVNDTQKDPIKGLPFTSRSLMQCFDEASEAFGWKQRNPKPGSMVDGDWLVGWGCATAVYPAHIAAAAARVRLTSTGDARVEVAAHDVGTGTYTVVAQTAAQELGISPERVQVVMADTALPPAPVSGGSNVTASVCNVVVKACGMLRNKLANAAGEAGEGKVTSGGWRLESGKLIDASGDAQEVAALFEKLGTGAIEQYAEFVPQGSKPGAMQKLYKGGTSISGGSNGEDAMRYAFGAEFVEVRVHRLTREIRVPRAVGAFAAGRIVNPRTAHSQLMGGMIWGISSALHEETEIDTRFARYTNTNLADYLVPVNADVPQIDVILLSEKDLKVNPLGIKGIGELGNVGTAAAVANAVYHATGIRVRNLPIRLEKVIA